MTTNEPQYDDDGNLIDPEPDPRTVTLNREQIRGLEDKARTADESNARAEAAERKLAFVEAGLDITDPKMGYFIKGYDGPLEPDKIKSTAAEAGFIAPPAGQGEPSQADQDAARAIQQAGNEAYSNPSGIPLEDAIKAAKTPDEIIDLIRQSGLPLLEDQ